MQLEDYIAASLGEREADLKLKNARVVNVFSGEIVFCDVAIYGGKICGFGNYNARNEIDLDGAYLAPGLIDGHVHVESSMLSPEEFASAVVPMGTTAIIADPHEIANVLGIKGVRYVMQAMQKTPLKCLVTLPSCVPATDMETSGAKLNGQDLLPLFLEEQVVGLAEMMNYPGVLARDTEVLKKISAAHRKVIDGHAPLLTDKELSAYIAAGISSDHECTGAEEALEKLRLGMYIMIREGSTAKNMENLLKVVTPANARRIILVTDDKHPQDLLKEGHVNYLLKKAVSLGISPVEAIRMVTLNVVERFNLREMGAVAPGYKADMAVFDDLRDFKARCVFRRGQLVAEKGELLSDVPRIRDFGMGSVVMDSKKINFTIPAQGQNILVIGIRQNEIVTEKRILPAKIVEGEAVADKERDIAKISVIERYGTANYAMGFVQGMGIQVGALASTVAHDSHNIIVVGMNDEDMLLAVKEVVKSGGGQAVAAEGKILAKLNLPIAGLMSDKPLKQVATAVEELNNAAAALGCILPSPFMTLSFMALPVIPELKITDQGLVDVNKFKFTSLFAD